jgi:hypothetical protein
MHIASRGRGLVAAAAFLLCLACAPASAQLFRAYLSVNGNDANACTLGAPCRLLPAALAAVQDGGEVWMMDSANFNTGPVSITKSVTILAIPGALGSVVALGGDAIDITGPTVRVALRNLNILPLAGYDAFKGVYMTNANRLTIQDCNIFNFVNGYGVHVIADAQVAIVDSVVRNNEFGAMFDGGATVRISGSKFLDNNNYGASASSSTGGVTSLTVTHSVAGNNTWGFLAEALSASANARLFVIDSVMESGNSLGAGAQVAVAGGTAVATVTNSLVVGNFVGVRAYGAGATVTASGNTLSQNGTGMQNASGAILESAGNNSNRDTNSGTITLVGTN